MVTFLAKPPLPSPFAIDAAAAASVKAQKQNPIMDAELGIYGGLGGSLSLHRSSSLLSQS